MTTGSGLLILWLILINLVLFIMMGVDKWKARRHRWRIPEKALLGAAVIGGSAGGILGMLIFHHKTKHPKFYIGYPVILVVQLLLAWFLITV